MTTRRLMTAEKRDEDADVSLRPQRLDGPEYADVLEGVPDAAWARTGRRGDGVVFTVASLALYSAHDPMHHLWDVRA